MVGEYESISNDDVLPPASSEYHRLSNVIRRQWLTAPVIRLAICPGNNGGYNKAEYSRIDSISLGLITTKSNHGELSLNLTRVNADNSDSLRNQLLSQAVGERPDGSLGGTVDATTDVGLTTCDGPDVDNVAGAIAVVTLQHSREDCLCHVDQSCHVGGEHDVHVIFGNFRCLGYAFDQAAVV